MIPHRMLVGKRKPKIIPIDPPTPPTPNDDWWKITAVPVLMDDNTGIWSGNTYYAAIPFHLKNVDNVTLTVNWGDDTEETLTSADYQSNDYYLQYEKSIHPYPNNAPVQISIKASNWNDLFFSKSGYFNDVVTASIISIDSPIPRFKGIDDGYNFNDYTGIYSIPNPNYENYGTGLFSYWSSLSSLCEDCLKNYSDLEDFRFWFKNTRLVELPPDLFKPCTNAKNMSSIFSDTLLQSLDKDLFKYCTKLEKLNYAFRNCRSLSTIPNGFFSNNTKLTSLKGCFEDVTLTRIPSDLLKYNPDLTDISNLLYDSYNVRGTISTFTYPEGNTSEFIPSDFIWYNSKLTSLSGSLVGVLFDNYDRSIYISSENVTSSSDVREIIRERYSLPNVTIYAKEGSSTYNALSEEYDRLMQEGSSWTLGSFSTPPSFT